MLIRFFFPLLLVMQMLGLTARAYDVPALSGPVQDEVGILSQSQLRQLEGSLYSFRQNHGVQIQVYIPASLHGEDIAGVAIQIFDKWQLGNEKTDRGLLFLIAPNERRMRIEVGQGLEGDIPDVIAKRIIADVVRPYFQRGEFDQGIFQGVAAIQSRILKEAGRQGVAAPQPENSDRGLGFWVVIFLIGLWVLLFIFNPSLALYILFSGLRGGGGGGGGGWSGGGVRSSGGGASGDW